MIGLLGSIGDLCESLTFPVRHAERILRRFTIGRILGEGWWGFDGITEFSELTELGRGKKGAGVSRGGLQRAEEFSK